MARKYVRKSYVYECKVSKFAYTFWANEVQGSKVYSKVQVWGEIRLEARMKDSLSSFITPSYSLLLFTLQLLFILEPCQCNMMKYKQCNGNIASHTQALFSLFNFDFQNRRNNTLYLFMVPILIRMCVLEC